MCISPLLPLSHFPFVWSLFPSFSLISLCSSFMSLCVSPCIFVFIFLFLFPYREFFFSLSFPFRPIRVIIQPVYSRSLFISRLFFFHALLTFLFPSSHPLLVQRVFVSLSLLFIHPDIISHHRLHSSCYGYYSIRLFQLSTSSLPLLSSLLKLPSSYYLIVLYTPLYWLYSVFLPLSPFRTQAKLTVVMITNTFPITIHTAGSFSEAKKNIMTIAIFVFLG